MDKFNDLWDEFNVKLYNYIKSKVSTTHDAEDILQDVFVKIYKNLDKLESKAAVSSWIYKITKHTIIDFYKKRKDLVVTPESLYDLEDDGDDADNMNDDIAACIRDMIFTLPEKYKAVYDMYENQSLKHKEISEALDISLSTSKVRLKRAKDMFRDKLIDCCDFSVDKYGNIIDYKSKGTCEDC